MAGRRCRFRSAGAVTMAAAIILAADFTMADFVEVDSTVAADFMVAANFMVAAVSVVKNHGVHSATAQGVAGFVDCKRCGV